MSRVEVYYNLHRQCLSWRLIGNAKGIYHNRHYRKNVRYAEAIGLHSVRFAVQPAGRAKVIETKRKNVHAFVRGYLVSASPVPPGELEVERLQYNGFFQVTYNPYKYESFVTVSDHKPIYEAGEVVIVGRRIFARNS